MAAEIARYESISFTFGWYYVSDGIFETNKNVHPIKRNCNKIIRHTNLQHSGKKWRVEI